MMENKVLKAMKIFYCLPIVFLFAFTPVKDAPTTQKLSYFKQILSSSPWQQSAFTVSPSIQVSENLAVNDLYYHQDEDTRNSILKFDMNGTYYVILGESILESTMFAARSGNTAQNETTIQDDEEYEITEDVTTNILETGSWNFNDNGDLVLVADNGRMKEQILEVEQLGTEQLVINFTQEIGGEYHTFAQVFDAKPFLELGW